MTTITTTVEAVGSTAGAKVVKVKARALKATPDLRVNVSSRARAMVAVGVINSVTSVTMGEIDRLTKVRSKEVVSQSRMGRELVYEIEVKT